MLQRAAARVGALDLGFVPGPGGQGIVAGMLRRRASICSGCSVPTRSTPRGIGAALSSSIRAITATAARPRADVVLPGAAYTEKNAT